MRKFLESHPMMNAPPLDPRDAFFGGRTGNIVTRYKITGTEKIRYVDVYSMYPYVLKTAFFQSVIRIFTSAKSVLLYLEWHRFIILIRSKSLYAAEYFHRETSFTWYFRVACGVNYILHYVAAVTKHFRRRTVHTTFENVSLRVRRYHLNYANPWKKVMS